MPRIYVVGTILIQSISDQFSTLITTLKTSHFEMIVPHIREKEGLNDEEWDQLPVYEISTAKKGGISLYLSEMSTAPMMYRHQLPEIGDVSMCTEYHVFRRSNRLWHFIMFEV